MRYTYSIFAPKQGKKSLGIPSYRWKDSVKIYLEERVLQFGLKYWIQLAHDRIQW
jgi:hypothetical protein